MKVKKNQTYNKEALRMTVKQARKILKENGVRWFNSFDLRPFESDYRDNIRKASIRMVRFIYNGRTGDE